MSGFPSDPVKGRSVTAAEMILLEPSADRREVKKVSRFAASSAEYRLPAPDSLGYSCPNVLRWAQVSEWEGDIPSRCQCLEECSLREMQI